MSATLRYTQSIAVVSKEDGREVVFYDDVHIAAKALKREIINTQKRFS